MKIKNLILSLILILSIGVSNTMPAYAAGEFDPTKGVAFNEIRDEVLGKTRDFTCRMEFNDPVCRKVIMRHLIGCSLNWRGCSLNNWSTGRITINDLDSIIALHSVSLDLFRKGEGDCEIVAYAISKLFRDKGIRNEVLRITYTNGDVHDVHVVVCYEKDECVEGETGLGIVDFFEIKNYEQQAINSGEIESLIASNKKTMFMCDASTYFENKNIANIEEYRLNKHNGDGLGFCSILINTPISDYYGGWRKLSTYLKEKGIKTKFDEIMTEAERRGRFTDEMLERLKKEAGIDWAEYKNNQNII